MTTYQVAIGWDAISSLADIEDVTIKLYDPRAPLTAPGRVSTLLSGARQADGYTLSSWVCDDYLTTTRMRQLLTQCGLRNGAVEIDSAQVTVRTPGEDRDFEYWNAWIYHPRSEYLNGRFGQSVFPLALVEYRPRSFSDEFSSEFE